MALAATAVPGACQKSPGLRRWGCRRKERGPVRGADGPAPGDPQAAAELPVRVLKTPHT